MRVYIRICVYTCVYTYTHMQRQREVDFCQKHGFREAAEILLKPTKYEDLLETCHLET